MERHSDHRTDLIQFYIYKAIVVSHRSRIQFFISLTPSMDVIKIFNSRICLPDRRKTGSLCSHNINADPEICTEIFYARPYKFHYFILHISVCKNSAYNGKRHILRSYTGNRLSCEIDSYNFRAFNIIGPSQKLFN